MTSKESTIDRDSAAGGGDLLLRLVLCLLIVAIVFGVYFRTLSVGFLLDDFYHMDYLLRAFDGDNSELMKVLFGSWSGPTGLNSFRPLTSFGLMVDFVLWKENAFGYHLSNLLMYSSTCLCVFWLVSRVLANLGRSSLLAAFLAGALFALYPIHPESVAWIIGRVDTQCVLFFLLALIFYFKHRKRGSNLFLILSFVFFLASLTTKEMAVVLPVVVAAAELLLADDLGWQKRTKPSRLILVSSFFAFLAVFAVVRTAAIGTLVGGYGDSSPGSTLSLLRNFLDVDTMKKIIFGVNEENPLKRDLSTWATAAFLLSMLPLLYSLISKRYLRLVLFLLLWLVVSLLPTFQIWHIYPNLVGSRLFFLGSVPFCMLIAIASVLPFSDFPEKLEKITVAFRTVSILAAVALGLFWLVAVRQNLQIWVRAGDEIRQIHSHVERLAGADAKGKGKLLYFVDLPQDDAGAGLIGRPEYMRTMLSPPLARQDFEELVITSERILSRNREFIYPGLIEGVVESPQLKEILLWNQKDRAFKPWRFPTGKKPAIGEAIPLTLKSQKDKQFWFRTDAGGLNPFGVGALKLELPGSSITPDKLKARLLYRSSHQPPSWIDYSNGPVMDTDGYFIPYWNRSWLLNGEITEVGIEFMDLPPGFSGASPPKLTALPAAQFFPSIELNDCTPVDEDERSIARMIKLPCDSISPIKVSYNVEAIPGAEAVMVMVALPEQSITVYPGDELPADACLLFKKRLDNLKGEIAIPDNLINKSIGRHQVVVLAVDKQGKPLGYLSEPRIFEICPDRPPEIK